LAQADFGSSIAIVTNPKLIVLGVRAQESSKHNV
jgi:hypothetical protein